MVEQYVPSGHIPMYNIHLSQVNKCTNELGMVIFWKLILSQKLARILKSFQQYSCSIESAQQFNAKSKFRFGIVLKLEQKKDNPPET